MSVYVSSSAEPGASGYGRGHPDAASIVRTRALNGGSDNLLVNGQSSAKVFTVDALSSEQIWINEIRFVFSCQNIDFNGSSFGPRPALTNGIKIEIISDGVTTEIGNIKLNEDWMSFASSPADLLLNNMGSNDILVIGWRTSGAIFLKADSSDKVKITIQDKITHVNYKVLNATVYGIKEA